MVANVNDRDNHPPVLHTPNGPQKNTPVSPKGDERSVFSGGILMESRWDSKSDGWN